MQGLTFARHLARRIDAALNRPLVTPLVEARAAKLERQVTGDDMKAALYRAMLYALPDEVLHETGIMWEAQPRSLHYVIRRLQVMARMLLARRGVSTAQWEVDPDYDSVVSPLFSIYLDKLAGEEVSEALVDDAQQGPSKFKESMRHAQWGLFTSVLANYLLVAGHLSKCTTPEEELAFIKAWYCGHVETPDRHHVKEFLLLSLIHI